MVQLTISLVLIVVALNVAILLYARTATRRGEIAVRTALGASRGRIVTQLFVEALVLALVPAFLGLALAQYALEIGNRLMFLDLVGGRRTVLVGARHSTVHDALRARARRGHGRDCRHPAGASRDATTRRRGPSSARRQHGLRLGRMWSALIVAQVAFAVAVLPGGHQDGHQGNSHQPHATELSGRRVRRGRRRDGERIESLRQSAAGVEAASAG